MSRIRQGYKREIIEVTSLPLRDGGYTVHFFLERHGHDILVTQFESGQRFDTDEEALAAGVKLGQHQIDIGYEPKGPVVENVTASAHATEHQ
ncbi:MAG: hypothetical protein ABSG08_18875 [Terriglobales bacterium]